MKRKIVLSIVIVLAVLAGLAGIKALQIRKLMTSEWPMPTETVASATVQQENWENTLSAVGSITAVQGVTITPELPGIVRAIKFESGAVVAAGDLLVQLDTSTEEAQLQASQAQANLARINANRMRELRKTDGVSQSELDNAEAALKQHEANNAAIQAAIDKKHIRAPFAGRLGIRMVNLGEYLEAGQDIVSLQSLAPVYADFSLPQQDLSVLKTGAIVRVATDAYPVKPFEGIITAINPDLDHSTRSVKLQATLENKDELLRPGMFARVEIVLPGKEDVLAIPATAVLSAPYGDSVYVIEQKTNATGGLMVRQQFVRLGKSRGELVSVETGLKPGDKVVSTGVFKLQNGMTVVENNNLTPPPMPKPADS